MSESTLEKMLEVHFFKSLTPKLPQSLNMSFESFTQIQNELQIEYGLKTDVKFLNRFGIEIYSNDDFSKLKYGEIIYCIPIKNDFPFKEFMEVFEVDRILGKGGFGIVKLVIHKYTREKFALKITNISDKFISAQKLNNLYEEALIIKKMSHPNIIKLYNAFHFSKTLFLLNEYIEGGNLYQFLGIQKILKEDQVKAIMKQLISATNYLHERGIVHRDIKLENILISSRNPIEIKLIDFGISCQVGESKTSGTLLYMAPESLEKTNDYKFTQKIIDSWSIGVILYYIIFRIYPFYGETVEDILESFKIQKLKFPPHNYSKSAIEFIVAALEIDPKKRIEVYEMVNHIWLKEDAGFGTPIKKEQPKEDIKFDDKIQIFKDKHLSQDQEKDQDNNIDNKNKNINIKMNINSNSNYNSNFNGNFNPNTQANQNEEVAFEKSLVCFEKSKSLINDQFGESNFRNFREKNKNQSKEVSPTKETNSPKTQIKLTSNQLVNAILLEKATENMSCNPKLNTNIQEKIDAKQHYLSQTLKAKSTRFLISKDSSKESKSQKVPSPFNPCLNSNFNSDSSSSAASVKKSKETNPTKSKIG